MFSDFDNLGYLKLKLLQEGVGFNLDSLKDVKTIYTERKLVYNCGDEDLGKIKDIPASIILNPTIVVSVRFRKQSPWNIKSLGEKLYLYYHNKSVREIFFPKRPKFYGMKLSNGWNVENVVTSYCVYNLGLFTRRYCYYWATGNQCRFCSLGPTKKIDKDYTRLLNPFIVAEALKIAVKNSKEIKNIEWSGENLKDNDKGVERQIILVDSVKNIVKDIPQHLCIMPPNNLELIKEIHNTGIGNITFSLEVFDQKLFEKYCPGKSHLYGYTKFLEALNYAVTVFGRGKVSCNLIAGLEPLSSLLNGCEYFFERGIIPSIPIFHPDKGSALYYKHPPTTRFLLEMARELTPLYVKHKFIPILHNARGASVDSEIYEGWFK